MNTLTAQRYLDLPPGSTTRGFVMRYGYQRGMMLVYRSTVTIYRTYGTHFNPSQHEELEAIIRVKIIDVDQADRGARLIVYHEPRHHRVGNRNVAPSDTTVVYTKQNEFGEPIESTDPSGAVNLILPRMAVQVGAMWREIEQFVPPRSKTPVELVRNYRIEQLGGEAKITCQTEDLPYTGDDGSECVIGGKGEYVFDTQYGVVTRQSVESTSMAKTAELNFEIQTIFAMELVDE